MVQTGEKIFGARMGCQGFGLNDRSALGSEADSNPRQLSGQRRTRLPKVGARSVRSIDARAHNFLIYLRRVPDAAIPRQGVRR